MTFCSQSSSVHKHCYASGYSHPLVNEKRQGTTQSISQLQSSIITSRCFSCICIPVRLQRTKPVFSPQPNNLYNRPRCFSLLLFFIDFHHQLPPPQHFPPTPTHELFSSLSPLILLLLTLYSSPHTHTVDVPTPNRFGAPSIISMVLLAIMHAESLLFWRRNCEV